MSLKDWEALPQVEVGDLLDSSDAKQKASAYQIAAGRIELLAWDLMGLDILDHNRVDAYAGAIWALARLAQKENEI